MELKKIALMGLGAVGSYIYWGLSRKEGIDLSVIADGDSSFLILFRLRNERAICGMSSMRSLSGGSLIVTSLIL